MCPAARGPTQDTLRAGAGDDLYGGPDDTKTRTTDEFVCGGGLDTVHVEKSEHARHHFGSECEAVVT